MDTFYNILIGIVTTIICAIGAFVIKKLGYIDFFKFFKSKRRIKQAGIVTFFQNRFFLQKDVGPIEDYIAKAEVSVKYVGLYLFGAINHQGINQIVNKQINKNVDFTFCIISPDNPYLTAYAAFLDITVEDLKSKIKASLAALENIRKNIEQSRKGQLRIKLHNQMILTSYWNIDEGKKNSLIQLDHKMVNSARMDSYGFEIVFRNNLKKDQFYETIRERYNTILISTEDKAISG